MALINCPECGKEISDKSQVCIHCGYPINNEKIIIENIDGVDHDVSFLINASLSQIEKIAKMSEITGKDFEGLMKAKEIVFKYHPTISQADVPKCPKCGSTNIQMVPRKWSALTGFMTNKVDRVCVNCKCKF